MAKKYDNDFKVIIVELLKSGLKVKDVSDEYNLNDGLIRRWRRECEAQSGDFSKKREVSDQEQELKILKKEMSLRSVLKRKFKNTTDSNHSYPIPKNELNRDFNSL